MTLLTALFTILVGCAVMYAIYKFVPPSIWRNILLFIIGAALCVWFLDLLGFIQWLQNKSI